MGMIIFRMLYAVIIGLYGRKARNRNVTLSGRLDFYGYYIATVLQ